jgi:hypothetical protein
MKYENKLEMHWKSYDKDVWFTETVIYSNSKTKKSYYMYHPLYFISISLFLVFYSCFVCCGSGFFFGVSIVLGGATIQWWYKEY